METKEKLLKEIQDAKEKLALLEYQEKNNERNDVIKPLVDFTDDEKIKHFNTQYKSALNELEEYERDGYSDDDNKQYDWESFIEILSRPDKKKLFWEYWNSLDR